MKTFNQDYVNEKEQDLIKIIDSVLIRLEEKPLINNHNFLNDRDDILSRYSRKFILKKPEAIRFELLIHDEGIQIDIDRSPESCDWSYDYIMNNQEFVINVLEDLFTCSIRVEYYGTKKTIIYFINSDGDIVRSFKDIQGLFTFKRSVTEVNVYQPIFS